MNQFGQSVCLNMIVKNEAPVIRRCLDSVRPIIDSWVIVDTGSTDGTQELIRELLKNVPGELHERGWVDFAHNRSEALTLARGHGDYVFLIDADEVLELEPGFELPRLTMDSYNLLIRYGGCSYLRKQLVRNTLEWRYEGVLHEYITCGEARTEDLLSGISTVPYHDGARARDALTYRRDALLLEKALLDTPDNARYVFYLAQSYRDAGDPELALRNYKRRAEMGGWPEEVWFSLYQAAQLKDRLQTPWPEVMESYLAAWQYQSDRAGPLFRIGMHYQAKGEYQTSHVFLRRAMEVPRPAANRLFVEQSLYDFQLPLEYAVSCYYVGEHVEAILTNNALLRSGLLPGMAVDQVVRNRRFSVDAVFPKEEGEKKAWRLCVVVPAERAGSSPELDDALESLFRLEHAEAPNTLRVVLLYEGTPELAERVPEDGQVRVQHGTVEEYVREHCATDEIVLLLPERHRIAEPGLAKVIGEMFSDAGCQLAYGQLRKANGQLGTAEPASAEQEFSEKGAALPQGGAIAFRAGLLAAAHGGVSGLFAAAGFRGTRFSDDVWTVEAAKVERQAPAVLTGKLPSVSCLMVTLDRLQLAKRSIQSFASQTYADRELVIVTDGVEWFRKSLERYVEAIGLNRKQVRVVRLDTPGLTLGKLRNISMDAARGEIVCQWDDDDYSHPDRLMIQAGHMLRNNAEACLMNDHLQFIEEQRVLCWIDWTIEGQAEGALQYAPGTLMMRADHRWRYPEEGPYARQGEDSILLADLCRNTVVTPLANAGYLYLYQYHGRNTFSREHHYRLASCRTTIAHLNDHAEKIRETARYCSIAKPCFVLGRDGPAFGLN